MRDWHIFLFVCFLFPSLLLIITMKSFKACFGIFSSAASVKGTKWALFFMLFSQMCFPRVKQVLADILVTGVSQHSDELKV